MGKDDQDFTEIHLLPKRERLATLDAMVEEKLAEFGKRARGLRAVIGVDQQVLSAADALERAWADGSSGHKDLIDAAVVLQYIGCELGLDPRRGVLYLHEPHGTTLLLRRHKEKRT